MNSLSLLICLATSVLAQLKVQVNPTDLIQPAEPTENNESIVGDFESEKLDHRRRRRRKMLASTVSPSLKLEPTEPRITMKPATEILRNTFSRAKGQVQEQKVRMVQNNRRKRRFKPKKPRLPETNEINDSKTENKTRESAEKVPVRFSNVLMTRAKVEEHDDLQDNDSQTTQIKSPIAETFETTNMERNRVVLLRSGDNNASVSLETELQPKYLHSTTSRTFSEVSVENMKISGDDASQSADSNEAAERKSLERTEHNVTESDREIDHVINVGLSIEEVERATERKSVAESRLDQTSMKDMADPALYRFEYRVLSDTDVAYDDLDELGDNSFMSLNTLSPDGLFHPENSPTYEQLLEVDDDVLLKFEDQFGIREENPDSFQEKERSREIISEEKAKIEESLDSETESVEKFKRKIKETDFLPKHKHPNSSKFRSVENYPVPVPRDYPQIPLPRDYTKEYTDIPQPDSKSINQSEHLNLRHHNLESNASKSTPEDKTEISTSNSTNKEIQKIPRTAKLEVSRDSSVSEQQVTKSVYTVTTPASFVFFEQTISPATKHQETNNKFNNLSSERPRPRTRGQTKNKVSIQDQDREINKIKSHRPKNAPKRKKEIKKEIDRNSIIGSSEKENKQSLTNLRIALQSNDVHYFPNREPYYPGHGGGSGYRPPGVGGVSGGYRPPGVGGVQGGVSGGYQPPTSPTLPPTQIHHGYHPPGRLYSISSLKVK